MSYSTAFYRAEAAAEENVLNWFRAGLLWRKAIEVYPNRGNLGQLGERDIAMMTVRAETCEYMHKQETEVTA